jgi:hypothetical protein
MRALADPDLVRSNVATALRSSRFVKSVDFYERNSDTGAISPCPGTTAVIALDDPLVLDMLVRSDVSVSSGNGRAMNVLAPFIALGTIYGFVRITTEPSRDDDFVSAAGEFGIAIGEAYARLALRRADEVRRL